MASSPRRNSRNDTSDRVPRRRQSEDGRSRSGSRIPGRRADGRSARAGLPVAIINRLQRDPSFSLCSRDGKFWIDPYSGASVELAEGEWLPQAKRHLLQHASWRQGEPLTTQQLLVQVWRLDLVNILRDDRSFRLWASDGRGWLNPYTGNLEESVPRPVDGGVTRETILAMAQRLAVLPNSREREPLERSVLRQRYEAVSGSAKESVRSGLFQPVGAERSEQARDLKQARDVQEKMIRPLPEVAGWELAARSEAQAEVGGDCYDFELDGDILHFFIADVSGHGLQGALVTATMLKALRILRRQHADPKSLLASLNDELRPELLPSQFVTACAGRLQVSSGLLEVALAGHHPALLINPGGTIMVSRLGRPGPALGILDRTAFSAGISTDTIALQPGDLLLQFTDGIVESGDEEAFGVHRLASRLLQRRSQGHDASVIIDDVFRSVGKYASAQEDDLTMIAIGQLIADGDNA